MIKFTLAVRLGICMTALVLSSSLYGAQPTSSLEFNGLEHNAIGDAQLEVVDEQLVISNIGESGLDGVLIDLDGAREFSAEWGNVSAHVASDIASMQFGTRAVSADEAGSTQFLFLLVQGLFLERGGAYLLEIMPDYGQSGSERYRYEVFNNGEEVVVETASTPQLFARLVMNTHVPYPTGVRLLTDQDGRLGYALTWRNENGNVQIIFTFRDNAVFFADELRIFPAEPVTPLESLTELNLWLGDIDPLVILSEAFEE